MAQRSFHNRCTRASLGQSTHMLLPNAPALTDGRQDPGPWALEGRSQQVALSKRSVLSLFQQSSHACIVLLAAVRQASWSSDCVRHGQPVFFSLFSPNNPTDHARTIKPMHCNSSSQPLHRRSFTTPAARQPCGLPILRLVFRRRQGPPCSCFSKCWSRIDATAC